LTQAAPAAADRGRPAVLALRDGRGPGWLGRNVYLDITRLHGDTGFRPGYDTTAAVADYIGWLRSGNER
jgi:UDP-glucose 4-epimerase